MKLSRPVSWFLLAFGVWSWFIWITFAKNLWQDGSGLAFDDAGHPTAYFWIHLLLAIASFLLGTAIGVIGFRGLRALAAGPARAPQNSGAPASHDEPAAPASRDAREAAGDRTGRTSA